MVQFLSINFFSWISSIFVGFFKSSLFCVILYFEYGTRRSRVGNLARHVRFLQNIHTINGVPSRLLYYASWGGVYFFLPSPKLRRVVVKLTTELCLVPWLRISGNIPPLHLYDLTLNAGTDFTQIR